MELTAYNQPLVRGRKQMFASRVIKRLRMAISLSTLCLVMILGLYLQVGN
jgi:hypothetical protein